MPQVDADDEGLVGACRATGSEGSGAIAAAHSSDAEQAAVREQRHRWQATHGGAFLGQRRHSTHTAGFVLRGSRWEERGGRLLHSQAVDADLAGARERVLHQARGDGRVAGGCLASCTGAAACSALRTRSARPGSGAGFRLGFGGGAALGLGFGTGAALGSCACCLGNRRITTCTSLPIHRLLDSQCRGIQTQLVGESCEAPPVVVWHALDGGDGV